MTFNGFSNAVYFDEHVARTMTSARSFPPSGDVVGLTSYPMAFQTYGPHYPRQLSIPRPFPQQQPAPMQPEIRALGPPLHGGDLALGPLPDWSHRPSWEHPLHGLPPMTTLPPPPPPPPPLPLMPLQGPPMAPSPRRPPHLELAIKGDQPDLSYFENGSTPSLISFSPFHHSANPLEPRGPPLQQQSGSGSGRNSFTSSGPLTSPLSSAAAAMEFPRPINHFLISPTVVAPQVRTQATEDNPSAIGAENSVAHTLVMMESGPPKTEKHPPSLTGGSGGASPVDTADSEQIEAGSDDESGAISKKGKSKKKRRRASDFNPVDIVPPLFMLTGLIPSNPQMPDWGQQNAPPGDFQHTFSTHAALPPPPPPPQTATDFFHQPTNSYQPYSAPGPPPNCSDPLPIPPYSPPPLPPATSATTVHHHYEEFITPATFASAHRFPVQTMWADEWEDGEESDAPHQQGGGGSSSSNGSGHQHSAFVPFGGSSSGPSGHHAGHLGQTPEEGSLPNGQLSDKMFTCSFEGCGKLFTRRSDLKTHARTHTGQRPYLCPVCNKAFTTCSNLRRHERTHTGHRPFVCDVFDCNKSFSQLSHLKRHRLTHFRNIFSGPEEGSLMTTTAAYPPPSSEFPNFPDSQHHHHDTSPHQILANPTPLRPSAPAPPPPISGRGVMIGGGGSNAPPMTLQQQDYHQQQ